MRDLGERAGDAAGRDGFQWKVHAPPLAERCTYLAHDAQHRIIELIHYALLQGNDGVVRNVEVLRADLSAALGDVAVADAHGVFECGGSIGAIEWVQLESG